MINPANTKLDMSVRNIRAFIFGFEKLYGKKELSKFIESTGMPLSYFEDENNWISFEYCCNFFDRLVQYTGNIEIPYEFGLTAGTDKSWGIVKTIISSFISCSFTYKSLVSLTPRWAKCGKYQILKLKKNKATIEYKLREDLKQNRNNCLVGIQSQLCAVPTLFNLPPAKIKELQCAAEGADSCIYEISWRNPPYKKFGLYFLFAGILISILLYKIYHFEFISYTFISVLFLINIPISAHFIWKLLKNKKLITENYKKIEEQNELLSKHLEEIERANEFLQKKIEQKTAELLTGNKDLEIKIADLENNEKELIQTGKMTLMGGLSEQVANRLKNPLEKVKAILTNLTKKSNEEDFNESIEGAKRAADRCEKTLNELLSFSNSKDKITLCDVNINKLLAECVKKANEEKSDPYIKINTKFADELPLITADYKQLEQIIMIMLTNAEDAITEAFNKDNSEEGEISIGTSFKNKNILIEIKDTGCGIPKTAINKIFDPFFSTKTTSKRKGMGLTLSFNYIKQLAGKIDVKSEEGKGTEFIISIPAK